MFQLNFSHAHQFLSITHRNFKNTTIKLLTNKLAAKLILLGLLALAAVTTNFAHAESNVAGEEITIYADDTFKPAPRALGNIDRQDINKSSDNRVSDSFDRELHVDANDQQDTMPIDSNDLWQRIKNGYAIPDSTSDLVTRHEEWYSSRPDYIKRMVERSQRYLFHIVEEVEKRGMPTEIALLPMIESAYNPQANSTSNASGIWQFIPSTGKHFGLKQNWWVDNRRNVTFATDAALSYLQKLYGMFGAWDLALAAYNAGEGTVGRAIERNRKLGLPTDYENLELPAETRNYVPKLQAIKNLMTNPEHYGLQIQTIANTPYFAKVTAPAQIDAHLAARLAEISDDEFLALNPGNKRPVIATNGEKHELLLPILSAQTFRNNLAVYDKPLVSWRTYFAKRGERLENIASKFGIQVAKLRNANNLPSESKIKNSATILVPNDNKTDFKSSKSMVEEAKVASQGLQSTENNIDINAKQDSANLNLANLDNANAEKIIENDQRNINKIEPVKQRRVTHRVKKGETMQTIAKRYGINVKQIMALNSMKNNTVKVGQVLSINQELENTVSTKQQLKTNDKNSNRKITNTKKSSTKKTTHNKTKTSLASAKNKTAITKKKH